MRFTQLLRILRAHAGLIFLCLMLAWVVAGIATVAIPAKYVSTSSVLFDFADSSVTAGTRPAQLYSNYLATQIDLLSSQVVALKVVDRLHLVDDATARARYLETDSSAAEAVQQIKNALRSMVAAVTHEAAQADASAEGSGNERYRFADQILKHTTIRPSPDSNVVQVSYSAASAQAAADATNAIVKAYIDTTLELSVNPARTSSEWLNSQIQGLTTNVQNARAALAEFQQRTGIIGSGDADEIETTRLTDLNGQLIAAQSQNHPAIQALKADLARAQAKINDLPPQLGPNHPAYKRAQSEAAAIRKQLEEESSHLASDLRREIAGQRGAMLSAKQQHAQLASLKDVVDNAQHALDEATRKETQVRMSSQITQTNVSVVRVGVPPRLPTTPNPLFNFSLATIGGILLGIGLGLWREVACRFVRSADDIRDFLGIQVLGVLHSGRRSSSGRARLQTRTMPLLTANR